MSFGTDVQKYIERKKLAMNNVVADSLFRLSENIIMDTPVITGRLRGNWQATIDYPSLKSLFTTDKGGEATVMQIGPAAKGAAGHIFYLTNNVDYALRIEFLGHTMIAPQRPEGMVGVNVDKFQEIWRQTVRNYGGTGT